MNRKNGSSTFVQMLNLPCLLTRRIRIHFIFLQMLYFSSVSFGQNGLEGVIVEKYYVTTTNDTIHASSYGGIVSGAVVYRIYLDLKPNYTFQAAYGSPEHPLFIRSDQAFYNQTYLGEKIPTAIPNRVLSQNLVSIDSWLSAGAVAENYIGVPKNRDKDSVSIPHTAYLKALEGHPDGMAFHSNPPKVVLYAIENEAEVFHTKKGNEFSTSNGAWACLGRGAKGLDSLGENHVLIGQFTTSGTFSFELNVQLGTPNGQVENYVARNPQNKEIEFKELIYSIAAPNHKKQKRIKR